MSLRNRDEAEGVSGGIGVDAPGLRPEIENLGQGRTTGRLDAPAGRSQIVDEQVEVDALLT